MHRPHCTVIQVLPLFIFRLRQLQTLKASSCQLTALSPRVGALQALEVLGLSGNRIKLLPAIVTQLPRLRVLNVRDNPCGEGMASGQGVSIARSAKFEAEVVHSLARVTVGYCCCGPPQLSLAITVFHSCHACHHSDHHCHFDRPLPGQAAQFPWLGSWTCLATR